MRPPPQWRGPPKTTSKSTFATPPASPTRGVFTEAAANDGSVTGSVTATLSGDTFANDVVSATPPHVTVTNVPGGLTAALTRTSDTVVTLTLTGNATAHANANDVSNISISFRDDAFVNQTASTVAGSSKNDIEVDFRDASSIAYSGSFTEVAANDGSVTGSVTATLTGDTFAAASSGTTGGRGDGKQGAGRTDRSAYTHQCHRGNSDTDR